MLVTAGFCVAEGCFLVVTAHGRKRAQEQPGVPYVQTLILITPEGPTSQYHPTGAGGRISSYELEGTFVLTALQWDRQSTRFKRKGVRSSLCDLVGYKPD